MLVVSGTDEGLTSSAKGSRTFEGHSSWSREENSLFSFVRAPASTLEHLNGVLKQVTSQHAVSPF